MSSDDSSVDLPVQDSTPTPFSASVFGSPLVIEIQVEGHDQWAYLFSCPSDLSWSEILRAWTQFRVFRLESLAVSLTGEVLDPLEVRADLAQRTLVLGVPSEPSPFSQQAHTLIALARLVSELGFPPTPEHLAAAEKYATQVLYIPRFWWWHELTLLLCGSHVQQGLQVLFDTRVLGLLLPEVHQMVGFADTSRHHHKDLWEHTAQVVAQAIPHPLVRWAALLHDVGKLWTRTYGAQQTVHFYQHEELGAVLVEGIGARLHMPAPLIQDLAFLVRHHLRPNAYHPSWTDTAVRRLIRDTGRLLVPLLHLSQADMTSGVPQKRQQAAQFSTELQQRIQQLLAEDQHQPLLPKGIGHAIMQHFQWTSGQHIGRLKSFLEQQITAGLLAAHQEPDYYITYLQNLPCIQDVVESSLPEGP